VYAESFCVDTIGLRVGKFEDKLKRNLKVVHLYNGNMNMVLQQKQLGLSSKRQ
jgi:hypothetical protein